MCIIVCAGANHVREHSSTAINSYIPAVRSHTCSRIGCTHIILKAFGIYPLVICNRVWETFRCEIKTNHIAITILSTTSFAQVELIGSLWGKRIELNRIRTARNLDENRISQESTILILRNQRIIEGSSIYSIPVEGYPRRCYISICQVARFGTSDTSDLDIIYSSRRILTGSIGVVPPSEYHLIITRLVNRQLDELVIPCAIQIEFATPIKGSPTFRQSR